MAGSEPQEEDGEVWEDSYGSLTITQDTMVFSPPLYRQRYLKVKNTIISVGKGKFTKVVDLGCSEMKFFRYLLGVPGLKEVVLVDKDEQVLQDGRQCVNPLAADYLFLRQEGLRVRVIRGDATTPHPCLANTHAVTMIELVEHMPVCELPGLVRCVFGYVKPQLVVVTTPNSDFNQYIPGFIPGSFRHWDHKFEWTSLQFHQWCEGIVKEYREFTLEISGCGRGPNNTYCSQVATFTRSTSPTRDTYLNTTVEEDWPDIQHLAITDNLDMTDNLDIIGNCDIIDKSDVIKNSIITNNSDITGSSDIKANSDITHNSDTTRNSDMTDTLDITGALVSNGPQSPYKVIAEYEYPYDRRTPEERDRDNVLGRFFTLRKYLQNVEIDTEPIRTALLPPRSPPPGSNTQDAHTSFFITFLRSEDSHIVESETDKEYLFYIIDSKFAILPMRSLLAWMNYGAEDKLTIDAVRVTVAEECFETVGSGDNWMGKLLLWEEEEKETYSEDSSEDETSSEDGGEEWWNKEKGNCGVREEEWWGCDVKGEWSGNNDKKGSNVEEERWSGNSKEGSDMEEERWSCNSKEGNDMKVEGWGEAGNMFPSHTKENWDIMDPDSPLDPNWT